MKTISIITPCYNVEHSIAETIKSAINNTSVLSEKINLEYIVCDGKSTDNTIENIEKVFSEINQSNVTYKIISEKDGGMYDALAKGINIASGEITAYINAGDYYSPHAFDIVIEVMNYCKVRWLTGLSVSYNDRSHIKSASLPYRYHRRLIKCGFYSDTFLPFIQQESTFWDSSLNSKINNITLSKFKLAGDFYLWQLFSKSEELYIIEAWLGGYKTHDGQLSEDMVSYHHEMKSISSRPRLIDYLAACTYFMLWYLPPKFKRFLNRKTLFRYNKTTKKYTLQER